MSFKSPSISDRLKAVVSLVHEGNTVCDVGCDHGFVPIYLIANNISPRVLAMDVRKGPLSMAKEHVKEYAMENYIETRLSDGLEKFVPGEAQTLIVAGMGGPLMLSILESYPEKTGSFRELILQPQSELFEFRQGLRALGYLIVDEKMILEDGKYYPMMKAIKNPIGVMEERSLIEDMYGPVLLEYRDPVLKQYLEREKGIIEGIMEKIKKEASATTDVLEKWENQYRQCLKALKLYR